LEPELNPALKTAIQVPDATIDAWRLPLHFLATARANGARVHNFSEVIGFYQTNGAVTGIRIFDFQTHSEYDVHGDVFINAAGAWAGKIGALAGVQIPVLPGPGVMVAVNTRLTNMVINRLHKAGEGDIIVPQRQLTILGTSIWLADDPDATAQTNDPLEISRDFDCYDHQQRDNLTGLVSVIGGKATTLRLMAEKAADLICRQTGHNIDCQTKTTKLLNYRQFYKQQQKITTE